MNSTDDDFGDLYADVVLQAKSAINNALEFTKLYTEPEPVPLPGNNNDNKTQNLKPDTRPEENSSSESTRKASSIAEEGDDESDSEDELKIVLNDEDCKRFPVNAGCGDDDEGEDGTDHVVSDGSELTTTCNCHVYSMPYSQYKYMRSHVSTFPSNLRVNGSAKGDWEDNGFNHHHGFNSGQIASVRPRPIATSVVPQCAYGFSLPWYRTILDINIDSFEDKPWSHPVANISDFFNFGFNEESWKRYCSLLDQCRDHTFIRARFPFYKSSKIDQAYESGFEHEKVGEVARAEDIKHVGSSSKFSDQGERQLELPKGRAIEVEGSMVERQPSMDVRRPRFRDSDVVIQINVQDSAEDFFVSGREEVGPIDGNSSDHDTFTNRNLEQDQKRGVHSCGYSDGELPADSVGRDVKNFDISSAFRRCSTKRSVSNQMSLGSNSHGNGKISEQDEYHHQNMNAHTSEGTETSKKGPVGMNTCKSGSRLIEAELSLSDRHHFSPIPSSSGSDSELSKDSGHADPAKICTLLRKSVPNSGTELQDFVRTDYKNSRRNGFKIKKGDGKCYSRRRSPSEQDWKHHRGRHHSVTDRKIYPESDDYPSLLSNDKYDGKSYLRHGPFKEKWKDCDGVCFSTSKRKIHDDSGPHPCLMSDAEGLYYRNYKSVDCSGQKQRSPDFDYHNTEDFSYYRETKVSSGYGSKRFGYNHISHHKHPCSTYDQYFRDQMGPCGRKKRDEDYNLERSGRVGNEDDMARNWYRCEKGLSVEEKIPLVYGKSGRLALENSSTSKERYTKWRGKSERLRSGNRVDRDGSLPYYQEDDFALEKYGRPFTNRKGDSPDRTYDGGLPFTGRESKISVQRGRYFDSPGLHVDELRPIEVENGYPGCIDHQVSISWSYREGECYPASGGRWHDTVSSIDDVYDDKPNERYGRHGRRICDEEHRDSGGFGLYNDIDDPIHLGRRRRSWQPKELRRMDDELIARDQGNECFAEKASFSYEQIVTHERIHAKYESEHDGIFTDNAQLAHHRYNLIREGSSAKCVNRSTTIPRCGDTVDFVVGEGKSAGGRPEGKRLMCNGRLEKMELKIANEQTTSEDFHGSERVKAIKTGNLKEERNKITGNWLNKDQVIEHNEDLDIEVQIIMEELDMENHLEKKHVSKSTVPTRNLKKRLSCSENACNVSNNVRDYDKQHILETLAKMEKRRERFKDPITFKKEVDKNPNPQADLMVDTVETKQQRPARKRRWGGS